MPLTNTKLLRTDDEVPVLIIADSLTRIFMSVDNSHYSTSHCNPPNYNG